MPKIEEDHQPSLNGAAEDRVKLAVNVCDLLRLDPFIRSMLLRDKIDPTRTIVTDPDRVDETAVPFVCDLLTAASACDVLRAHDRRSGEPYPTRVYVHRGRGWTRLAHGDDLTEMSGGRVVLGDLFNVEVEAVDVSAPPNTTTLAMGRIKR